tara:strand:+ start:1945 stop:2832 length:888 start_codon:yes stop_codon:yes gene_type:complete
MTIKQQGGIFGRNPTFNDVTVEGTLTTSGAQSVEELNVDNINIDGNTISSTNSNGDINVSPNGSGREILTGALELRRTTSLANYVDNFDNPLIYSSYAGGNIGVNSALVLQPRGSAALPIILANGNGAGNMAARLRVEATGDVTVSTGNLVIGTSGKGIDFSATAGTGTSELFDDYEEGTWTPTVTSTSGTITTVDDVEGFYTKIGREVTVYANAKTTNNGTGAGNLRFSGLPFTPVSTTMSATGFMGMGYNSSSGKLLRGRITGGNLRIDVANYDGTYPTANGRSNSIQVTYYV